MSLSLEVLENTKRRNLMGFTAFFGMAQLSNIITYHFKSILPETLYILFSITSLVGISGWVLFTYLFYKTYKLLRQNPKLFHALHDERASWIDSRATSYGFLACMIFSSLLFAASVFFPSLFKDYISSPPGAFTAHSIIVVAFISSMVSLILLDEK